MTNDVTKYLKYANLQMASEALLDTVAQVGLKTALTNGNNRSSKFTSTQADQFIADKWTVVDHKSNTSTGFSGTLFKNSETNELVMSFRSTEFVDDGARDNKATNELELKQFGWAFGQIADMEKWYPEIRRTHSADFLNAPGGQFAVTGYSLGGSLASAFAKLRVEDGTYAARVSGVYTFNGAGVGDFVGAGGLQGGFGLDYPLEILTAQQAIATSGFACRSLARPQRQLHRQTHHTPD